MKHQWRRLNINLREAILRIVFYFVKIYFINDIIYILFMKGMAFLIKNVIMLICKGADGMFTIVEKVALNPTVTKMVIKAPLIAKKAKAGQFIILRSDDQAERIPLTIADYDRLNGTITIIFQIVGAATYKLNQLNAGDAIHDFVGPLGRASEIEGLKKVCVIGGGVGCAIAYPVAKALHEQGSEVCAIAGFRTKDLVILEDEFKAVSEFKLVSDDGSVGEKGLVTDVLRKLLDQGEQFDEVIAIGPLVMMKFVCKLTQEYNVKTVVSMNPIMIDGTGMCGGCRLTVGNEVKFACVDGPDFDGALVDFDEAIARSKMYHDQERHAYEHACNLLNKGVNQDA